MFNSSLDIYMILRVFVIILLSLFSAVLSAKEIQIFPKIETDSVFSKGDAADDPAFWFNINNPTQSVVFGTDKKAGIHSFSLDGKRMQFIPSGKINNIDIRSGYSFGAKTFSLLAASNVSDNSVATYLINENGIIDNLKNKFITNLDSIYGLCMHQNDELKATFIFVSDVDTLSIYQYRVLDIFPLKAQMVRQIKLSSTSEGCVADDESGILYFAQEDDQSGIYYIHTDPNKSEIGVIDRTVKYDGNIIGDTEGLAILKHENNKFLFASSQGSSDFVIYDLNNKRKFLGRITIVKSKNIDGVSRTDGIEIFGGKLNDDFPLGIFIAQDDMNMEIFNLGEETLQAKKVNQNFKLMSIESIIEEFID